MRTIRTAAETVHHCRQLPKVHDWAHPVLPVSRGGPPGAKNRAGHVIRHGQGEEHVCEQALYNKGGNVESSKGKFVKNRRFLPDLRKVKCRLTKNFLG